MLELETTSETSANVSIGDLNGDGHLDLLLAKGRHWPLVDRVLLGDGRGRIAAAFNLGDAADRTYSGLLVDLDGDGDLDVVISNDDPDPKLVYLNDGKGHFRVGSTFGRAAWETRHASVADLNDDGQPDIIVANRVSKSAPANYVCLNRGQGRFDADCLPFSHEPATTVAAADFNRDGRIDLAVPHRDGGQSYVYLNGGKATFPDSNRIPFGPADAHIRMAEPVDLDGDGLLDLVAIADLDEDGLLDIAVARSEATNVVYFAGPPVPTAPASTPTSQTAQTSAQLERRDQPVSADDLAILVRAEALLEDEAAWNRNDDRECRDDEATRKRSLFCALQRACIDVLGSYDHRRVALQEVRFAVEDATRGRDFEHRLMDFNNLPETRLTDIRRVLSVARQRVAGRLKAEP